MTNEQWENLQKLSAYKDDKVYTKADKYTFWFCGATMAYLAFQIMRAFL